MTYTHLTVGQSRIPSKPPRAQPPCTEPVKYGANILSDPGVELQLANFGGGPDGDEVPQLVNAGGSWYTQPYVWSDHTVGPARSYVAQVPQGLGPSEYWRVSTANPRSGTRHLRWNFTAGGSGGESVYFLQLPLCGAIPNDGTTPDAMSARVEPGDYVRFGFYGMASSLGDVPTMQFGGSFYDAAYATLSSFGDGAYELTTGYVWYEMSSFAPAGTKYVSINLYCDKIDPVTFDTATNYDFDDFVLKVSK